MDTHAVDQLPIANRQSAIKPVPTAMRESLVRYGGILARSPEGGMFWRCAREEQRNSARLLAEMLFHVIVPEAEALERVEFSAGYTECWLRLRPEATPGQVVTDLTADGADTRPRPPATASTSAAASADGRKG